MRKALLPVLLVALVLLAGTSTLFFMRYRQTSVEYANVKSAEQETRARYAETFSAVAEIQDSLNAIAIGEASVPLASSQLTAEQRLNQPNKREALERIALLNASVQRTKARIRQLESGMRRGGVRIAGLEKLVANLKQTVLEKESQVALLSTRVDSLQTTVTGLTATVEESRQAIVAKDLTIGEKQRELGTVYYIIGSKQALTRGGVVAARGGVLGMGKTLLPTGRVDPSLFTALNTDVQTVVRIPSAKVEVLSAQPTSSYELAIVGGATELHITNPEEFRRIKHLVIMTKA
jgi:hypothetical protein